MKIFILPPFFSWWGFHGAFLHILPTGRDEDMKRPSKSYEQKIDKFPSTKLTITPPIKCLRSFRALSWTPFHIKLKHILQPIYYLSTAFIASGKRGKKVGLRGGINENNNVSDSSFSLHFRQTFVDCSEAQLKALHCYYSECLSQFSSDFMRQLNNNGSLRTRQKRNVISLTLSHAVYYKQIRWKLWQIFLSLWLRKKRKSFFLSLLATTNKRVSFCVHIYDGSFEVSSVNSRLT